MRKTYRCGAAVAAVAGLLGQPAVAASPLVWRQPNLNATVAPLALDPAGADAPLSNADMIALVRQKIKYVFVIFNENNAFDHEYGTFPGVNGIYSDGHGPRAGADTPGFTQKVTEVDGATYTVQPFRIGPQQNASFQDSTDHTHRGVAAKLDVVDGKARMDGFSQREYSKYATSSAAGPAERAQGRRYSELVMSHIDCDTIPFFWQYANRFTIFDNIFETTAGPSTPNAISMFSGQAGETQWVKHGAQADESLPVSGTINGVAYSGQARPQGVPVVNDPQPWNGSAFDVSQGRRQPTSPKEHWSPRNTSVNLTFASLPLTLAGADAPKLMQGDRRPGRDLADVANDIPYIAAHGPASVAWRWYENGYAANEPNEPSFAPRAPHANYVSHHNAAQYFGYVANNRNEWSNLRGEHNFFYDINHDQLPKDGGLIYLRGGFYNIQGLLPPIQNRNFPNTTGLTDDEIATIDKAKSGDDDHPGYSDHQITEAMVARAVNAIASHPDIWRQSAIIITYDEGDGQWDHVPPRVLAYGPDNLPLSRGPRVPLILISPFARAGAVSHAEGDHNAVIQTINAIFGLTPLSSLPEEAAALKAGDAPEFNRFAQKHGPADFHQKWLGPRDANSPETDSLLSGFSPMRLKGLAQPLPASYAMIPGDVVTSLPHYGGQGCKAIGVTPTDADRPNSPPPGFNSLPSLLSKYN